MDLDVVDLNAFYKTPLGLTVRRIISREVRSRWRGLKGGRIVGLGYGIPYIGALRSEASCVAALMPETQGALVWPSTGATLSVLVEDRHLPLPDNSVNRLLLMHSLEATERPGVLLRELWRVLEPEGRLLIVVPNRRSVWARIDATPFGHGRPYSRSQLERLLLECLFTPVSWGSALHLPPLERRVVIRTASAWERIGRTVLSRFGGVLIVEARKELMAPVGGTKAAARVLRDLVTVRRGRERADAHRGR